MATGSRSVVETGRRERVFGRVGEGGEEDRQDWLLGVNERAVTSGFQVCGLKNFVDRVIPPSTHGSVAGDPQGCGVALW